MLDRSKQEVEIPKDGELSRISGGKSSDIINLNLVRLVALFNG